MITSFSILLLIWFTDGLNYYGMSQVPTVLVGGGPPPFQCDVAAHQIFAPRKQYTNILYQSMATYPCLIAIIPIVVYLTRRQAGALILGFECIMLLL